LEAERVLPRAAIPPLQPVVMMMVMTREMEMMGRIILMMLMI
jgi:hypothetical protein